MITNVEPVYVDFETQPIYEVGAIVMTVLLFSEPRDTIDDREKAVTALCAWALRTRAQSDLQWAQKPLSIKPCYAVQSYEEADRILKDINRRMLNRLTAGRIVLPFLQKSLTGELPIIGKRPMKPTVNKLAELVLPTTGEGSVENLKSRIWSPGRPVSHLAGAFEFVQDVLAKGGIKLDYSTILWDETFLRFVLKVAEELEGLVAKSFASGDLRIDPATLIRIRVADKKSSSETNAVSDPEPRAPMGDTNAHDTDTIPQNDARNRKFAGA